MRTTALMVLAGVALAGVCAGVFWPAQRAASTVVVQPPARPVTEPVTPKVHVQPFVPPVAAAETIAVPTTRADPLSKDGHVAAEPTPPPVVPAPDGPRPGAAQLDVDLTQAAVEAHGVELVAQQKLQAAQSLSARQKRVALALMTAREAGDVVAVRRAEIQHRRLDARIAELRAQHIALDELPAEPADDHDHDAEH